MDVAAAGGHIADQTGGALAGDRVGGVFGELDGAELTAVFPQHLFARGGLVAPAYFFESFLTGVERLQAFAEAVLAHAEGEVGGIATLV